MADNTDRNDELDTNRIAPRSVDPEHRDKVGGDDNAETSDDRNRTRRRQEPAVVEADGGDIAGIAGGGIDSKVSGLGGDRR